MTFCQHFCEETSFFVAPGPNNNLRFSASAEGREPENFEVFASTEWLNYSKILVRSLNQSEVFAVFLHKNFVFPVYWAKGSEESELSIGVGRVGRGRPPDENPGRCLSEDLHILAFRRFCLSKHDFSAFLCIFWRFR